MSSISSRIAAAPFMFVLVAGLSAQTGYVPANPVTPPTVSPPVLFPTPTIDPPVVTAPTLSPESADDASGSTGSASGSSTAHKTTTTTTKGSSGTAKAATTGADGSKSASSTAATASALSMLGLGADSPLLKALSGSDSDESSTNALSGLLGTSSSSSTDSATLKKILALLEKQQAQLGTAATTGSAATAGSQSITSGGELVRFIVNGSNVAASTTTLVSSILAKDGSFLLTGDRRYVVSRETRTETFYLLCRKNADGSYRLHADVTQDAKNEYSFLYRLSRRGALKGTMTGDLLVFRTVDPDFRLDLVIRVIAPSVSKKSNR